MWFTVILLLPQLQSATPDRLKELIQKIQRLSVAGDHRAVGLLVPALRDELAHPHPETAEAWNELGLYYENEGDHAGAERAYKEGLRVIGKEADPPRWAEPVVLKNLAALYLEGGQRPGYAEVLVRRALKLAVAQFGAHSGALASYLYILGVARAQQGDRNQARQYFQQAFDVAGGTDRELMRGLILANVVTLAALENEWYQARDSSLESIDLLGRTVGPSHPELIRPYLNLGRVYMHLGEWQSAQNSIEKAREITEARLGPTHPIMVEILTTSAVILRKTGHRNEARDASRRAKRIAASQPIDSAQSWVHVSDLARSGRH
jgi:tetratricopeptide (TPR) repeat protein